LTTLVNYSTAGADADPIGGVWTPYGSDTFQRLGNVMTPSAINLNPKAFYNALTPPDDSWALISYTSAVPLNAGVGVHIRAQSANEYYYFTADILNGQYGFGVYNFGFTGLGSGALVLTPGDTIGGECQGNNIRFTHNGSVIDSATDSTFPTGGQWGVVMANGATFPETDLFQAGDFSTPTGNASASNIYSALLKGPR
jgi:hypothetical protein